MSKQLRASLYFSRRRDKDIIRELKFESIEQGDINWEIKELMRDGIKFRQGGYTNNGENDIQHKPSTPIQKSSTNDVVAFSPPFEDNFEDIVLERKELNEEDINNKLNSFWFHPIV